jgi:SAM-dependent methyltransferase
MGSVGGSANERWREALAGWAIPDRILSAAPESPWVFPVELFASRADAAPGGLTPSNRRALEVLPEGGSVLDVGCGAGAASLPLAGRAGTLIGVDSSREMLDAFAERAERAGVAFDAVQGRWPDEAGRVPIADVVVCHHVAYNAPDLDGFAGRLTDHARRRVVFELTPTHPTANLSPLWVRFHGLDRPDRPTADDAVDVLTEAGLDAGREDWEAPPTGGFARRADLVAWIRRRLCLTPERDPEIDEALADQVDERDGLFGFGPRHLVTLWWPGSAPNG